MNEPTNKQTNKHNRSQYLLAEAIIFLFLSCAVPAYAPTDVAAYSYHVNGAVVVRVIWTSPVRILLSFSIAIHLVVYCSFAVLIGAVLASLEKISEVQFIAI